MLVTGLSAPGGVTVSLSPVSLVVPFSLLFNLICGSYYYLHSVDKKQSKLTKRTSCSRSFSKWCLWASSHLSAELVTFPVPHIVTQAMGEESWRMKGKLDQGQREDLEALEGHFSSILRRKGQQSKGTSHVW